jgi:two-component system, response regulator PdtaR
MAKRSRLSIRRTEARTPARRAFRKIQRLSMNNRKSMREVAEAILLAHQAQSEGAER